jgi:FkbM family methyltransferase
MKMFIQNVLNNFGIQIKRYPDNDIKRRLKLIRHFKINKIFDVGANVGDYAMELRKLGFTGKLISFEPLSEPFKILQKNASNDSNWDTLNIALGDSDYESEINIAGNINSSSILEMLPTHLESAPQSAYRGREKIEVKKLDDLFNNYYKEGDNVLVKVDTQGYEMNILNGGEISLQNIKGIQIEMSIIQLYNGGILYKEMIDYIEKKGFKLYSIENGFSDPNTGELLQIDGIFFKNEQLSNTT